MKLSKNKKFIIALATVLIIIIITCTFLFIQRDSSSSEETLNAFIEMYNTGDTAGMLHQTDAHFLPSEEFDKMVEWFGLDGVKPVTLKVLEVISKSDVVEHGMDGFDADIESLESKSNIKISNHNWIIYNLNDKNLPIQKLCICVQGNWYIVFDLLEKSDEPFHLLQAPSSDSTSVELIKSSGPWDPMVYGTVVSVTRNGVSVPVTNVTLYAADIDGSTFSQSDVEMAWYDGSSWAFGANYSFLNPARITNMVTIVIVADNITSGDVITISSTEGFFGTSIKTVY